MANSRQSAFDGDNECDLTVFQRLGVTGEVTLTPSIKCGPVKVTCLEGEIFRADDLCDRDWKSGTSGDEPCRILIFQDLCVEVPVRIKVKATCDLTGMQCGEPSTDPSACKRSEHCDFDTTDRTSGTSDTSNSSDGSDSSEE